MLRFLQVQGGLIVCSLGSSLSRHSHSRSLPFTCKTLRMSAPLSLPTAWPLPWPPQQTPPTTTAEGSRGKNRPGPLLCPQLRTAASPWTNHQILLLPCTGPWSSPLARTQQLSGHLTERVKGRQGGPYLPASHCPTPWSWPPAQGTVQRFREMTGLGKGQSDLSSRCRGGAERLEKMLPVPLAL